MQNSDHIQPFEPSQRATQISPFQVMEIMEAAAKLETQGISVVHLEVGEPDFPTPSCVLDAAHKALTEGHTHYTHSLGLPALREAIAAQYQDRVDPPPAPDQILITAGTSPGMVLLFGALLEPGDEVILSDPHYPCYPNMIRFLGCRPVFVTVRPEERFQYAVEDVKNAITDRTRAIVINSPSNPLGAVLDPDRIQAIADLGIPIVSDEIYHGLVYGPPPKTMMAYTDRAFVIDGFSKRFAMTGWRLGYLVVPKPFVRPIQKLSQNFYISANDFVQYAALAALKEGGAIVSAMAETYNKRRKYLVARLKELGFGVPNEGQGAFYIFADIRPFGLSSVDFVTRLLQEGHVAATPGNDFGAAGEGFVRFSYASGGDALQEGMARIEKFLKTL